MAVSSVHEDLLALSKTRLEALDLNGAEGRVTEREATEGAWATNWPAYPLVVLSGTGLLRNLQQPQSCTFDLAYPITLIYLDRKPSWSVTDRVAHQKATQKLIDAFQNKPLALTYTGAHCTDVVLLDGPILQRADDGWQLTWRQLNFEAHVRQRRTS